MPCGAVHSSCATSGACGSCSSCDVCWCLLSHLNLLRVQLLLFLVCDGLRESTPLIAHVLLGVVSATALGTHTSGNKVHALCWLERVCISCDWHSSVLTLSMTLQSAATSASGNSRFPSVSCYLLGHNIMSHAGRLPSTLRPRAARLPAQIGSWSSFRRIISHTM
jgi:hypothetical protein